MRIVLPVLLATGPAAGSMGAADQAGAAPPRYVASGGQVYQWDGASPRVAPRAERTPIS